MTPERYSQVKEVLASAIEYEPERRAAFLAQICAGDEALRDEVQSLLEHQEPAANFIEESAFEVTARALAEGEAESLVERRIGPYRMTAELGRGGMGIVYLARRDDEQYEKQVAIKIIKRGMDTDVVLRRFRIERQILASLEHPHIARLIDGGTTEDGRPFFVMEYVAGLSIDQYCDVNHLSINERLKLFRTVCSAVQYAHQNLVIHRDIKPSNILITAEGAPKLLDFGIAKVLRPNVSSQTTEATVWRVMTPEYASPEQVRGERITTASDVYSLGVLLYELLTGHRPYRINSRVPYEVARVICEQEPEKPSTAISRVEKAPGAHGEPVVSITPESVGRARGAQIEKLRNQLAGDLDKIVLMAMRKEPQRRYKSVEQLSEDIRRYLEGLPVIAHKDTVGYRGAKFVKRHKAGVLAATLVAVALVAGLIATLWQAKIATEKARIADEQARIAREQRDRARTETAKAERSNTFLQSLIAYADPSWYSPGYRQRGDVIKVVDVLDNAGRRIDTELADQPEVRAELHHTIGNTYRALRLYDPAERHFRAALQLYREVYGERHPKVAESLYYLGAA